MLSFKTRELDDFVLVHFEITSPIEPSILKSLKPPEVNPKKGVVLSGRGPVWLYGFLAHYYHPTAWVATYDPRLGAVVVQSHVPGVAPGDVFEINLEEVLV
ncbi:CRISPR-associated ring nuclease Crn3/Csx3 [Thermococcus sp. MAR1]|uniref:CRISPR-associated ring nuclease Crn3/Csx3 n=1 Tax=Thermococcus sp. MAR1 TaxID=1638263 RepID=UPI00143BB94A|nr:CRISPR-associated ring nuclease Crn3/Csx3 [Thermococcus sp. MAR1]NJE10068.1 CRISPR-associated protein Csx3 [Thermococcus sp. MAR1]